ncbi:DUF423 domain-containing protein [Sphingosinicella terrae]|uniref:DUF423 domain-containing protein n=1 Tax=Sphingosinicella terrae TaxID=2172047 RepID=UPI00254954E6|nr:DUF423 domain-containing protein [Sphingosinicella terrae]
MILVAGALLGGSGIILGAFAAHALKEVLSPQQSGWWQTAVQYQMWQALALLLVAALPLRRPAVPALGLGIGVLIFSGSLYMMALGLPRWLGAVAPVGGGLMIGGWLALAWQALRRSRTRPGD